MVVVDSELDFLWTTRRESTDSSRTLPSACNTLGVLDRTWPTTVALRQ